MKVAIIGGGISGLSCGIYLAKNNIDVTIYEKNHYAGGFLTTWERKGSIIDGCMHWMFGTKDGTRLNNIWKDMGVLDRTSIYDPETFCSISLDDKWFHYYMDIDKFEQELLKYSENDDEEIKIFIESIKSMGIMEMPTDLPYDLDNDQKKYMPSMKIMRKLRYYLKLTIKEMSERFNSKMIKYALRNFLINENFNAYYFIQTLSNFMNGDASLPVGCSKSVQEGMKNRFLSYGGNILYNEEIKEILVENNIAKSIVLKNGSIVDYDYICLAVDPYVAEKLIKQELAPYKELSNDKDKYLTYSYCIASYKTKKDMSKYSMAIVKKIDNWSFNGISGAYLSLRQYGYDETLIKNGNTTIQVYITTYEKDYDIIKNMNKEEYKEFKSKIGEYFKDILEKEFNDSFELIDVLTPLTYERYNNAYKGTFMPYVLAPGLTQILRSQRVEGINNLVLANQWLMLPGGSCVAVTMGKFASQIILHDIGYNYRF